MNPEQLNATHGLAGKLRFVTGEGGFTLIEIDNGQARALISPYAGQVLSYRPAGEPEDLLFVSEHAYYQPGKAIKGHSSVLALVRARPAEPGAASARFRTQP
jgi:glucose-6-phosphate 1-epimerase